MGANGTHFVLVHGAGHGAWCWNVLITLLRLAGHRTSAPDLAAAGVNPVQIENIHSLDDYVAPLMDFMAALPLHERVVLVGHSSGGLAISAAMEKFPRKISVAVFVSAIMPGPNLTMDQIRIAQNRSSSFYLDSTFTYKAGEVVAITFGPKYLAERLYSLSPRQDLTLATLVGRPYPSYDDLTLTWNNYGSVRRVFVISRKDRAVTTDDARFMIENNPPKEVKQIRNSDHMVMYSKPKELFSILLDIAMNYH